MHDTDHSKEHARAAAKVGSGPETNQLSALDAVNAECRSLSQSQGGTHSQTDVDAAVFKGHQDLDVTSDDGDKLRGNPMGHH